MLDRYTGLSRKIDGNQTSSSSPLSSAGTRTWFSQATAGRPGWVRRHTACRERSATA